MKKVIYINLKGNMGDYAHRIFTSEKTGSPRVQALQGVFNTKIKQYIPMEATAENCKALWESLYDILRNANLTEADKKEPAYKEILSHIEAIGKEIAFVSVRRGFERSEGQRCYNEFRYSSIADKDTLVENYLALSLCYANTFKKPSVRDYYFEKIENADSDALYEQAIEEYSRIGKTEMEMLALTPTERALVYMEKAI